MTKDLTQRIAHLSPLKQALLKLEQMEADIQRVKAASSQPIAVTGMSCRFAESNDLESFWAFLARGGDAVREVPKQRWDLDHYYDEDTEAAGKMYTRFGSFIEGIEQFDPAFFQISQREAQSMDPQQRLLLEVSWEALEHAGLTRKIKGSDTGVFVGLTTSDYAQLIRREGEINAVDGYFFTGNPLNTTAGRLAYTFGLQGPCMALDTACSSSLSAIHQAVTALRAGDCSQALAGGVNLTLDPLTTVAVCRTRALAPDGRCKTFDAAANGFVRGEGCGVLVLQTMEQAQQEERTILALIRGTAMVQDGASSGFTTPNGAAQRNLFHKAFQGIDIRPDEIDYVEFHGTGTPLGDPIEVSSVAEVFGRDRSPEKPLLIGSVKTNLGHTESAAGMAGVIKVILSLIHETLPPHLHYKTPSPHIAWQELAIKVVTSPTPWPRDSHRRRANVNAFGASGTNVTVILEEAPAAPKIEEPHHGEQVLLLTAKTEEALRETAQRLSSYLKAHPDLPLQQVAYTLNCGRTTFEKRYSMVAKTVEHVVEQSEKLIAGPVATKREKPQLAFLYTGQGTQYCGMGRSWYQEEPTFRKTMDHCDEMLRSLLPHSLLTVMGLRAGEAGSETILKDTRYTQPALFAFGAACTAMLRHYGIEPQAVAGHSLGEFTAAYAAGVLSLEDGLRLVAGRAQLMAMLPGRGGMAVVLAALEQVAPIQEKEAERVAIAAINGPRNLVLSGFEESLTSVLEDLAKRGIRHQRLSVPHGFHSPQMDTMLKGLVRIAEQVHFHAPKIPMISNHSGDWLQAAPTPEYWGRHCRETVHFAKGIETLEAKGMNVFLEVGPTPTLNTMAKRVLKRGDREPAFIASLMGRVGSASLSSILAELVVEGIEPRWANLYPQASRTQLMLPTYPFQRERCWFPKKNNPVESVQKNMVRWMDGLETTAQDSGEFHQVLQEQRRTLLKITEQQLELIQEHEKP